MSYDFSDLLERWDEAVQATKVNAGAMRFLDDYEADHRDDGLLKPAALFLGSLIEDLRDEIADTSYALGEDDLKRDREVRLDRFDDEREVETGPIVLKGRNPVSILHELSQVRGFSVSFNMNQTGGESHTPVFGGSCIVEGEDIDEPLSVSGEVRAGGKGALKKMLARNMLKEHFGAKDDY